MLRALELIGLATFAVSGGLAAVRHRFDLVGVAALSTITAVGGGAMRDALLGVTPVAALRDPWYLIIPLAAALAVMLFHHQIDTRLHRSVLVFDAAGLGLFCVTGASAAVAHDVVAVGAVGLGVLTATGGGVVRDMLCGEPPTMFRADSVLYSIPAAAGATTVVMLDRADIAPGTFSLAIAAAVFLFRLGALRYRWHAPRPR